MTEISGFVEIPSQHLKAACEKYLAERQARIDSEREILINKEMNRLIFKSNTRNEAIEYLKKSVDVLGMSVWSKVANKGAYWSDKVEDLRYAACFASTVLVEVNMASLLKPYFEDKNNVV